jgi:hypothetical protein
MLLIPLALDAAVEREPVAVVAVAVVAATASQSTCNHYRFASGHKRIEFPADGMLTGF